MEGKRKIGIIIGIIVGIVVFGIIILIITHKNTYDLKDYVTIDIVGMDGSATAQVHFDRNKLESAIMGNEDNAGGGMFAVCDTVDSIKYEINKEEGIKNGDKLTVSFTLDEGALEKKKYKFSDDPYEITVENLEKGKSYDPFKDVVIEYDGALPNVNISAENTKNIYDLRYIIDQGDKEKLTKEDTFVVEVQYNKEDLMEKKVALTRTKKKYSCKDAPVYITKKEEVTQNVMDRYII